MRYPPDTAPPPVVLVVDDAAENLALVSGMLGDFCQVKVAAHGELALDLAGSARPDLILLDIQMPGMDGHEVCRRLKADPSTRRIPVIFLTGRITVADEQFGLELGAVDYITKPIQRNTLIARVRTRLAEKAAADVQRNAYRFVKDSLDHTPDPTLVADLAGTVLIANKAAVQHFARAALVGASVVGLMSDVRSTTDPGPIVSARLLDQGPAAVAGEANDPQGRSLLVRCVPSFAADDVHTGWILSLTDLTEIRATQRQRDEALRFLSHDLREPQSSILALLDVQNEGKDGAGGGVLPIPHAELLTRIERHARRALYLAENFVQFARAESADYRSVRSDLVELLDEAIDGMWALARERRIEIATAPFPRRAPCMIDSELVLRAIGNLLGNAVKFSPPGTRVVCALLREGAFWRISVHNPGPGIPKDQQARLFQPYVRLPAEGPNHAKGLGLGLAYVRTVAQRHGGRVDVSSAPGEGATFHLYLPRGRGK